MNNTKDKRDADRIKKTRERIRKASKERKDRAERSRLSFSFGLLSGVV